MSKNKKISDETPVLRDEKGVRPVRCPMRSVCTSFCGTESDFYLFINKKNTNRLDKIAEAEIIGLLRRIFFI